MHVDVAELDFDPGTCLFEPEQHVLRKQGLAMADAVVGVGDGMGMTLLISNNGT